MQSSANSEPLRRRQLYPETGHDLRVPSVSWVNVRLNMHRQRMGHTDTHAARDTWSDSNTRFVTETYSGFLWLEVWWQGDKWYRWRWGQQPLTDSPENRNYLYSTLGCLQCREQVSLETRPPASKSFCGITAYSRGTTETPYVQIKWPHRYLHQHYHCD